MGALPVKRAATPEEIGDTIVFLACKAPFLTGQSIVVDGGKIAA
jgi:NAD(P)-dependent dehydrogenase (short-subunit alcohol dehydrogenase family)